jgi:hypothetical protein
MSAKTIIGVTMVAVAALMMVMGRPAFAQEPTLSQVYQAAEAGNYAQAQRMMDEVLRAHPGSAKAHFVEAELLAKQGRLAAAGAELDTAKRIEPGLAFANPRAVEGLQRQIASAASARATGSPADRSVTPAVGNAIPWTLLLGVGLVVLIVMGALAMRKRNSTYIPASSSGPGYGSPAPSQPYGAAPFTPASGGIGSGIMGGLATGAAVGAGMVAGEALAHRLTEGHGGGDPASSTLANELGLSVPDNVDIGGTDFGVSDSASWDDNSGGGADGGGDWT